MDFYAHSSNKNSKEDWQLLADHLDAVSLQTALFADSFDAQTLGLVTGKMHDLGKYTIEFQKRLEGGKRVDHATWGAKQAISLYPQIGYLLAYIIAGHHAGLADGKLGANQKHTNLEERLKAALPILQESWKELPLPDSKNITLPKGFSPNQRTGKFQLALLTRMLYSCLVDADYLDTERYYNSIDGKIQRGAQFQPTLVQLREKLDAQLAGFKPNTEVNQLRANILHYVRQQAVSKPGLFSLTVPTGGGKTLTSLAFALDHAITHGLERIIYVIPFTSIVEQTAAVFREMLGDSSVLEHHSAFIDNPDTTDEEREKMNQAMENWDVPIIVTTSVQFFESLFSNRPSRCRKLHNIAKSVVILDEAQTLPLHLLRPCVTAIDELARNYNTSLILCTATQPALGRDQGFKNGLENITELAPNPQELFLKLRRTRTEYVGTLSDEDIVEKLNTRSQALCIVNNRNHAQALYRLLGNQEGIFHLSTRMNAKHRSTILSEVKQRLVHGLRCILVSTSLIEAGVDIDFPYVLRAEAGLDSVVQAGGRCNREGKRNSEESMVEIFSPSNEKCKPPVELKQYAQVFHSVMRNHQQDIVSLASIEAYFSELYWSKGDDQLDAKNLLELLRQSSVDSLPFEQLSNLFKMIDSMMYPIIVPFIPGTCENDPSLEQFLEGDLHAPRLGRVFQPYVVQVHEKSYQMLKARKAIQPLNEARFGEQFMMLEKPDLYDSSTGLSWDNPDYIASENSVF